MTRAGFETYVDKMLVPELRQGDIVVMDNLAAHKGATVRKAIEAMGRQSHPPAPRLARPQTIELAFFKFKALLRAAAARTMPKLEAAVRQAIEGFHPDECRNFICSRWLWIKMIGKCSISRPGVDLRRRSTVEAHIVAPICQGTNSASP